MTLYYQVTNYSEQFDFAKVTIRKLRSNNMLVFFFSNELKNESVCYKCLLI